MSRCVGCLWFPSILDCLGGVEPSPAADKHVVVDGEAFSDDDDGETTNASACDVECTNVAANTARKIRMVDVESVIVPANGLKVSRGICGLWIQYCTTLLLTVTVSP